MSCFHCWPNIYTHDQKRLLYVSFFSLYTQTLCWHHHLKHLLSTLQTCKWDKMESQPETTDWIGGGGGDYKGILIQTSAGFFRLPNNFSLLALHTKLKGSSWHSKFKKKWYIILEWHASLVVVTLASQHEGLGVTFTGQLVSFCVESAYTPHALWVHRLPPTVQRRLVCGVNWWL